MAQQDKLTYEGTFNHASTGLFKDNTAGEIEAVDHRTQVTNTKDSVPFTLDDSYTWPFPQVTAGGTDTYTATLSPPITAYAAGQKFQILFTNANTGASTLALNGLAALAVTKNGATALVAGDIPVGSIKILAYDGTRLQIVGDGSSSGAGAVDSVNGATGVVVLDAGDIAFTPAGTIAATTVQAAIEEVAVDAIGVQDLFVPASAMWPMITAGCSALTQTEIATSLLNIQTLDFDQTTEEHAQFTVALPRKVNLASFKYKIYWTASAGTATETVNWVVSPVSYSNDDPLTGTFLSSQAVSDALTATNDLHITSESANVVITGSASEDLVGIMIHRDIADTLAADAKLIGISLRLTTTSPKDE